MISPTLWLRLEGAAVFAAGLFAYFHVDGGWLLLLLILLAPDLSMLGYLAGSRPGAAAYNVVHSYLLPIALLTAAWIAQQHLLLLCALIWIVHIGMDRMLGYGLKLESGFRHTHLGTIGRPGAEGANDRSNAAPVNPHP